MPGPGLIILALALVAAAATLGLARVVVVLLLGAWLGLLAWGIQRMSRSRAIVRSALARAGYDILDIEYRQLRLGPFFSLWDTSRGQAVYRVRLREPASGREAIVWSRWGRRWPIAPDRLEFRSADHAMAARLNAEP